MKITTESPELTAYALGELPENERAQVELAVAADPALRAEVEEIRRTVTLLETELANENAVVLSPQQRGRIIAEAVSPIVPVAAVPKLKAGIFTKLRELWQMHQAAFGAGVVALAAVVVAVAYWPHTVPAKNITPVSDADTWRYPANRAEAKRELVRLKEAAAGEKGPTDNAKPSAAPAPAKELFYAQRQLSTSTTTATKDIPSQKSSDGQLYEADKMAKVQTPPVSSFGLAVPSLDAKVDRNVASGRIGGIGGGGGFAGAGGAPVDSYRELPAVQVPAADPNSSMGRRYGYIANEPSVAVTRPDSIELGRKGEQEVLGVVLEDRSKSPRARNAAGKPALQTVAPQASLSPATPNYYRNTDNSLAFGENETRLSAQGLGLPGNPSPTANYSFSTDLADALAPEGAYRDERYPSLKANPFQDVRSLPLSTFGLDVDSASYANIRRFIREGVRPPVDAVRVEEMINYFPYSYAVPHDGKPFGVQVEVADCPWNQGHRLVRIAVKAREIDRAERPRANVVFLIDVSGSMEPENKLPLVKRSMHLLLEKLGERDTVGVVTYAGEAKVAMEPTAVTADGRQRLLTAIDALRAGHGTHGSAGIETAYAMATNHFITGGVNRVMLCTDGDFNVGIVSREELLGLITERAKSGVFLSVLGYGMDNYKDSTMEMLADRGNGNYAYVDSFREAQKVLSQQVDSTLVTVAKDVKAQIEFNPERVVSWRQIGYEKRQLAARDFNDDTKDAGEIGAGHAVTILYELIPAAGHQPGVDPLRYEVASKKVAVDSDRIHNSELLFIRLRYKEPEGATSKLIEIPVPDSDVSWERTSADYKFAAAVAGFGEVLKGSANTNGLNWESILKLGEQGLGDDREGYRAEFIDLVRGARKVMGER